MVQWNTVSRINDLNDALEELEKQDTILDPGDGINEQKRDGYTICVLRKDLWHIQSNRERDKALAEVDRLREALERLARLGNEPEYGNSVGNTIAKEALGDHK